MEDRMTALVIDMDGNAALIKSEDMDLRGYGCLLNRLLGRVQGLRVLETNKTLKESALLDEVRVGTYGVPTAEPVWGYLKKSREVYGDKAVKFRLGYKATNGFSIPSAHVLEELYTLA